MHDVRGLMTLMGGPEAFVRKLDELFNQPPIIEGEAVPPDISGLIGQYAHGNAPSHHVAYLYAYAGAPWKSAGRVRQIASTLYGTGPEGLCGNEDCGQLSAWYLFSAMGFYPVNPAEGVYVIGAPQVEKAAIDLGGQRTFAIEAPGLSPADKYVTGATLNGKPLDRCWISHADIAAGGTLRFTMGAEPNAAWASSPEAAPPSMTQVTGSPGLLRERTASGLGVGGGRSGNAASVVAGSITHAATAMPTLTASRTVPGRLVFAHHA